MKFKITKEEFEQLEPTIQALYKEVGEEYQLHVEGLPEPEDVSGLKRQRDELLKEKKAEQEKRRLAEEQRQKEEAERLAAEGNYKQLYESSQKATSEWESKFNNLKSEIEQGKINQTAYKLAADLADGANVDILSEFIKRRLKIVEGDLKVTDANGNLTVSTTEQLKSEFKNDPRWASLIRGSRANGGGATNIRAGGAVSLKDMTEKERIEFARNNPDEFKNLINKQRGQ